MSPVCETGLSGLKKNSHIGLWFCNPVVHMYVSDISWLSHSHFFLFTPRILIGELVPIELNLYQ